MGELNSSHRYYDFKKNPELIRTDLEDFVGLKEWPAIQSFYQLLEWLNGADSLLESSDCAFSPVRPNISKQFEKLLECTGRLIVLYRNLILNTSRNNIEVLREGIHYHLAQIDPGFEWGVIGTTIMLSDYVTLRVAKTKQSGFQLMLTFWAWGDTELETMSNLRRLFQNLGEALRLNSDEIAEAIGNGFS